VKGNLCSVVVLMLFPVVLIPVEEITAGEVIHHDRHICVSLEDVLVLHDEGCTRVHRVILHQVIEGVKFVSGRSDQSENGNSQSK
jgi:hypothetical protein